MAEAQDEQETIGGHHRTEDMYRQMVARRCGWGGKRSGRSGQDKQCMEDTEWRKEVKGQWRAKEQATVRRGWNKDLERDKMYDIG